MLRILDASFLFRKIGKTFPPINICKSLIQSTTLIDGCFVVGILTFSLIFQPVFDVIFAGK